MKKLLLHLLFLLYIWTASLITALSMFAYPFIKSPKDPDVNPFLLYFLFFIVAIFNKKVLCYFKNQEIL
jgi:hypothetical protein